MPPKNKFSCLDDEEPRPPVVEETAAARPQAAASEPEYPPGSVEARRIEIEREVMAVVERLQAEMAVETYKALIVFAERLQELEAGRETLQAEPETVPEASGPPGGPEPPPGSPGQAWRLDIGRRPLQFPGPIRRLLIRALLGWKFER